MASLSDKEWFQKLVMWQIPMLTIIFGYTSPVGWRLPVAILLLIYAIAIAAGYGDWMLIAYSRGKKRKRERREEAAMIRKAPLRAVMAIWNIVIAGTLALSSYIQIPILWLLVTFFAVSVVCLLLANILAH